jgi:hypothetical protein
LAGFFVLAEIRRGATHKRTAGIFGRVAPGRDHRAADGFRASGPSLNMVEQPPGGDRVSRHNADLLKKDPHGR